MTTEIMDISQTAKWLGEEDDFVIITHRRPDGDTIGSAAALAQALRELGKTAYVLHNPEITPRYEAFLADYWMPEGYIIHHTIAVDTATVDLFPQNATGFKDSISLCIDHHGTNSAYAKRSCLDARRAACGELIYDILVALSGTVSAKTAEALYVAIATDTGSFIYPNTTAETLRIAAYLVEAGAPQSELNKILFQTRSKKRVKLEGMLYTGIEFHCDGYVAISTVTQKMLEEIAATDDDTDDIASIPSSIEGVLVGITIRESTSPNDCRVSVRSTPLINSADICARFGGGGHVTAAGFSIEKSISEIRDALLEILPEYLPET